MGIRKKEGEREGAGGKERERERALTSLLFLSSSCSDLILSAASLAFVNSLHEICMVCVCVCVCERERERD